MGHVPHQGTVQLILEVGQDAIARIKLRPVEASLSPRVPLELAVDQEGLVEVRLLAPPIFEESAVSVLQSPPPQPAPRLLARLHVLDDGVVQIRISPLGSPPGECTSQAALAAPKAATKPPATKSQRVKAPVAKTAPPTARSSAAKTSTSSRTSLHASVAPFVPQPPQKPRRARKDVSRSKAAVQKERQRTEVPLHLFQPVRQPILQHEVSVHERLLDEMRSRGHLVDGRVRLDAPASFEQREVVANTRPDDSARKRHSADDDAGDAAGDAGDVGEAQLYNLYNDSLDDQVVANSVVQHLTPFAINRNLPWQVYATRPKRFQPTSPQPSAPASQAAKPKRPAHVRLDGPVVSPRHRKLRPLDPLYSDAQRHATTGSTSAREPIQGAGAGVHAARVLSPRSVRGRLPFRPAPQSMRDHPCY